MTQYYDVDCRWYDKCSFIYNPDRNTIDNIIIASDVKPYDNEAGYIKFLDMVGCLESFLMDAVDNQRLKFYFGKGDVFMTASGSYDNLRLWETTAQELFNEENFN